MPGGSNPVSRAQNGGDSEHGADWVGGEQRQLPGTALALRGPELSWR